MYEETYNNNNYAIDKDIRSLLGFPDDFPLYKIVDYIILYLRKSRKDEEAYGDESVEETLARHLKTMQEWAMATFNAEIPQKNIKKEVVSGETIEGRPIMLEVLNLIENPAIKAIACIDVQRLGRGDLEDQGRLGKALKYSNTMVLTPERYYNINDKYDKKFFEQKLRESAEFLEYVKEKMGDGRIRSVLDRTYPHSIPPYGYDRKKIDGRKGFTLIFNEEEAAVCKLAANILINGLNIQYTIQNDDSLSNISKTFGIFQKDIMRENENIDFKVGNTITIKKENAGTSVIANYLNFLEIKPRINDRWTPHMVKNILLSLASHGYTSWGKRKTVKTLKNGKIIKTRPINKTNSIVRRGLWDPIYTREQSIKIKEILSQKSKPIAKSKELKNPLLGLIKCDFCGSNMQRRPYFDRCDQKKRKKRAYEIDKQKLRLLLREQKEIKKYSLNDIARSLHVSKQIVDHWFASNNDKFCLPHANKWEELKKLLDIETTEFDIPLTTFEEKPFEPHVDTLLCQKKGCQNVASDLELVEQKLIDNLKIILSDYKDYVKNYSKTFTEEKIANEVSIEMIEKDIKKVTDKLDSICDFLESGTYSQEMFNERKQKLLKQLADLEKKKEKLSSNNVIKKYNQKKSAIPKIENVLNSYDNLLTPEQKNDLLSTIIEKVYYRKEKGGRKLKENFKLVVYLKI